MTDFEERLGKLGVVVYPTKCRNCIFAKYNREDNDYWCGYLRRYTERDDWCCWGHPHERAIERAE